MMSQLALQADLWYNKHRNIVVSEDAVNTLRRVANLLRRSTTMDTLPPHAPEKQCTGPCGRMLPATPEYFSRKKNGKYGLYNLCKQCKSASDKVYRERPEVRGTLLEKKKAYSSRPDIRERRRAKDSTPEAREHRRIYRSQPEVREYERAYEETYHSRPEIQERYSSNKKIYDSRPDIQEHRRVYHSQPYVKEIYKAHSHNRRALKLAASGTYTAQDTQDQYKRQKGKCYYCHKKVKWGEHHVDHVIPLTRGGSNDPSNLVIACSPCNLSKNNKLPHEWWKGGRLL